MMADRRGRALPPLVRLPVRDNIYKYLYTTQADVAKHRNEVRSKRLLDGLAIRRMYDEISKHDDLGRFPAASITELNRSMNDMYKEFTDSVASCTDDHGNISIRMLFS